MKELSLFTGMGGGIYGSLILGWETVAYVEKDEYCKKVIKQRIADGWFDKGEIYGDIKEFNQKHAIEYAGKIDILTGGFPCQPFSVAGKRKGTSDDRYLFDEIIKTITIIQPRQILFENVPGLLSDPAIIEIYQSLNKLGYIVSAPLLLGSDDCGNIHRRKRVWIFAHAEGERPRGWESQKCNDEWVKRQSSKSQRGAVWSEAARCTVREFHTTHATEQLGNGAECQSQKHTQQQKSEFGDGNKSFDIANATGGRCGSGKCSRCERQSIQNNEGQVAEGQQKRDKRQSWTPANTGFQPAHGFSKRAKRGIEKEISRERRLPRNQSIRGLEDLQRRPDVPPPLFCGVDDELSNWRKQLKAIGNGQDPIVMATAYCILTNNI